MTPSTSESSHRAGPVARAWSLLGHPVRLCRHAIIAYRYSPERVEKLLAEFDRDDWRDDSPAVRLLPEEAALLHCQQFVSPVGIFAADGELVALTWAEDIPGQFDARMAEALVVGALVGFDRYASMVGGSLDADTLEALLRTARERYERIKAQEDRPLRGD